MNKKPKKKRLLITIIAIIIASLVLVITIPFVILGFRTNSLKKDYTYLKNDTNYSNRVEITGIELVTQHISCGYATIEMMSSYYGNKVDEDALSQKNNGAISTASSAGFLKEVNRSISNKEFVKESYLKNDALLKKIYASLSHQNPVAIEWAAKYENEWTLHFSLVTALDIASDEVIIYNPYGYIETISLDEFISRTSFNAYTNMPLFLNFGFAFGAFEKNAVFYAQTR